MVVDPLRVPASATCVAGGACQLRFDVAAGRRKSFYRSLYLRKRGRSEMEPVEIPIEDERLAAVLALIELDQAFKGERVAVKAARDPQRLDFKLRLSCKGRRAIAIRDRAGPACPCAMHAGRRRRTSPARPCSRSTGRAPRPGGPRDRAR